MTADSIDYYKTLLAMRQRALIEALRKSPDKFNNHPIKVDPKEMIVHIKFKGGGPK